MHWQVVFQQRNSHIYIKGHVELAGHEGQNTGRAALNDSMLYTVEMRLTLSPIIFVLGKLHMLVLL